MNPFDRTRKLWFSLGAVLFASSLTSWIKRAEHLPSLQLWGPHGHGGWQNPILQEEKELAPEESGYDMHPLTESPMWACFAFVLQYSFLVSNYEEKEQTHKSLTGWVHWLN